MKFGENPLDRTFHMPRYKIYNLCTGHTVTFSCKGALYVVKIKSLT